MINSVLSMKTLLFNELISSKFSVAVNNNLINFETLSLYHHQKKHYRMLTYKYDKLVRKFNKINALIQKTISATNPFSIKIIQTYFYNILLTFQKNIIF